MSNKHPTEGELRAYRDHAASDDERKQIDTHLAGCADCEASLESAIAAATRTEAWLAAAGPPPAEEPASEDAWARLQAKQTGQAHQAMKSPSDGSDGKVRLPKMSSQTSSLTSRLGAPRMRRLATAGAVVAVVAALFALQPVRALAGQLLGLFRVQKVIVLPVDSAQLEALGGDGALGQAVGRLFSDSVTVLHEPAPPELVADAAEASRLAGFEVRLPVEAPSRPRLSVHDGGAFEFTINRERAQAVLDGVRQSMAESGGAEGLGADVNADAAVSDAAGAADLALPEAIDGAKVSVSIPAGVSAAYGDCGEGDQQPAGSEHPVDSQDPAGEGSPGDSDEVMVFGKRLDAQAPAGEHPVREQTGGDCLMLAQIPSPEVSAPPELDIAALAEMGLRFMGFRALEAATFSRTVDWTSTLVLPVRRGSTRSRTIAVDGVDGVLLQRSGEGGPDYTILWVRDGRVYVVAGTDRDPARGLALADALP